MEVLFDVESRSYVISNDPARLDRDVIHDFLSRESYWARGVPRDVLDRAIDGSIPFGLFDEDGGRQVGFARVITDRATFAWLCDVFVLEARRGRGLGKRLIETIVAHPDLQGLRWFLLATADAHELYRGFGFQELTPDKVSRLMAVWRASAEVYGD